MNFKVGQTVKNKYTGHTGVILALCPVSDAVVIVSGGHQQFVNLRDYEVVL